jgi:hypothetical protein
MTLRRGRPTRLACAGLLLTAAVVAAQEAELRSVVVTGRTLSRTLDPTLAASRYSTDYSGNAIKRSSLDGSVVEVLVPDVKGPYGLSFDAGSRQLLWTSSVDEVVQTAPVAGGTPVTLPSSFEEGYAIAVTEGDRRVVYLLDGNQIIKTSQDPQTGAVTRDALLDLVSPDLVRGLALSADGTALYIGDSAGQMSQKLTLATRTLTPLGFETAVLEPSPLPLPSPRPSLLPIKPIANQPELSR